jgi:hypothetical protein
VNGSTHLEHWSEINVPTLLRQFCSFFIRKLHFKSQSLPVSPWSLSCLPRPPRSLAILAILNRLHSNPKAQVASLILTIFEAALKSLGSYDTTTNGFPVCQVTLVLTFVTNVAFVSPVALLCHLVMWKVRIKRSGVPGRKSMPGRRHSQLFLVPNQSPIVVFFPQQNDNPGFKVQKILIVLQGL